MMGRNPDGELYAIGRCECDTSDLEYLASATVDFVGKGLDKGFREIASVTCVVLVNVMKEAVIAGTYAIPGAGQYAAAARGIAKGVRLAAKSQGGKDLWKDAVQSSCNFRRQEDLDQIDQGFGIFEGSPDDFERHKTTCTIFNAQMKESVSVMNYILYMIEQIEKLSKLDFPLHEQLGKDAILNFLPKSYLSFLSHFRMMKPVVNYHSLLGLLQTFEKDHQLHKDMVNLVGGSS